MHNSIILDYLVLYLLCTGSFYLIYKAKLHFYFKNTAGYGHIYNVSLMVNIFIVAIGIGLHPSLFFNIFFIKNYWVVFLCVIAASIFGWIFVLFENCLCRTPALQNNIKTSKKLFFIVVMIAILEEIIFRGYINEISFYFGGTIAWMLIFFGIIAFGLSHLFVSWVQFFSKTMFAFFMTLFFIVSGNIVVPIVSHAIFNFLVVKKYPREG